MAKHMFTAGKAFHWAGLTLLVGLATTAICVAYYHATWVEFRSERFQEYVDKSSFQIRDRILSYERGLRGTRSALLAVGPTRMTLEQFRRASRSRDPEHEFPGNRGFGFIQRVPAGDDASFLNEAAKQGRPDLTIRQLSAHSGERYIIKYIEPEDINRAAVGLDIASESIRREAMVRAMRSGQATLTRPITLVQADGKKGQGFLLLLPVYPDHPVANDENTREESATGATYSPLVIDEILQNINPLIDGVNLTLSDTSQAAGKITFFGQEISSASGNELLETRELEIFGRTWLAEYRPSPRYLNTLPANQSVAIALVGGILSLLVSVVVYRELQNRARLVASRQRLEAFIANAPTALAMFDKQMRYLATSQHWLDDYLLNDRELIGKSHYEVFPNLPDEWKAVHQRALMGEEISQDNDRFELSNGTTRWLHWAIRPWHESNGAIGGVILFTEDVTERHEMIDALEAAKEAAEKADRAKTLFLGNMSHEMRTPVHQLSGMLSLFQRDRLDEKQARRLEVMKTSLQRLDTVIGGILTLVDLEAKSTRLEIKPIDLREICESVLSMANGRAQEKNLGLNLELSPMTTALSGDERHLRTILACYINNAITFSEQGEVRVRVSCVSEETSSVLLRIAVTDQGIGIPPEKLEHIFREFEQADNSHTRKYGGTGVGLAIVRKLARLMGGDAGCDSVVGQGSTFWATLTLVKSEAIPSSPSHSQDYQI